MIISIIAAQSKNGVIGNKGRIPWICKEDMKFFKEKTMGHPVIMGRKTFDSFPEKFRPLPGRFHVVLTRDRALHGMTTDHPDGPIYVGSLEEAIDYVDEMANEIFIIGGEEIYKEAIDRELVDRMYINVLNKIVQGDTTFPYFHKKDWIVNPSETKYEEFISYTYSKRPEEAV
jgi:dihydrofolate reductase